MSVFILKGYGETTYPAMFSVRILQRTHLCCSKWSFTYLLSIKLEGMTLKHHLGKAFLQEKMSWIQEHCFIKAFLNAGIKFRESRRMLS